MTPDDIIKLLDATCICGARKLHDPIQHAFAADLMSDVLRLNTEGLLLITGMANPQVIRTAEMADIPFILFVRDKQITAEMQQLAGTESHFPDFGRSGRDGRRKFFTGRDRFQ